MDNTWGNLALELVVLTFFGLLYYLYQRRKILRFEADKVPFLMNMILETLLAERGDAIHPVYDPVIEALDDFLNQKTTTPPLPLLKGLMISERCSPELKAMIKDVLDEIK